MHRTLGEPGRHRRAGDECRYLLAAAAAVTNNYSPIISNSTASLSMPETSLAESDYLRIESQPFFASELWRISLRILAALSDVDYGRFIATLRESVKPCFVRTTHETSCSRS